MTRAAASTQSALAFVLDGLTEYLELERELGTRTIEIDRALLKGQERQEGRERRERQAGQEGRERAERQAGQEGRERRERQEASLVTHVAPVAPATPVAHVTPVSHVARVSPVASPLSPTSRLHFVFLHHAALSPKAVEMMAKIIPALGETTESAPILFTGLLPATRVCVVLGALALQKWFPGKKGAPGQWLRLDDGRHVLITYSPEYFLRFATVTPAVQKMKESMWLSLKVLKQRLKGGMFD